MPPPRLAAASPDIFVNREKPLALINEAITEIPGESVRLLVFHGIGGQGKTALCRHVYQQVSDKKGERYKNLNVVEIDLRGKDKSDPINLLIWIRNGFAKAKIACPAFDIALALTWEATRPEQDFPNLTNAWLAKSSELMTESAPDMITALREVVEQSVETIPLLGPIATKSSKWLIDKSKESYLHSERPQLQELYKNRGELKKPYELEALLPWMLAQDLNQHRKVKPWERFILLVDEYERVFDGSGSGKKWEDNPFDDAMRSIAQETDGLLIVFFSREPLPWEKSNGWRKDLEGRQYPLKGLIDDDAEQWLVEAGVDEKEIREAMIDGAKEAPDKNIYPLLLKLQLEHWRQLSANQEPITVDQFHVEAESLEERHEKIVKRVLRDYGTDLEFAIERLSVCLRFDRLAFNHVIEKFGIGLPQDMFDQIANLSLFAKNDDGYVSMHRAFADIVVQMLEPDRKRESIETLLSHYEDRLEAPSIKELEQEHILALFEAAHLRLELSADGYIDWLNENTSQLSQAARAINGEQLWRPALELAKEHFGEAHPDTATSYNNVAYNLNAQGRYEDAEPLFRKGLEIRQQVLGEAHPSTATSYNNVASNLNAQGRYEDAEPLFRKAVKLIEAALGEDHPTSNTMRNNLKSFLENRPTEPSK